MNVGAVAERAAAERTGDAEADGRTSGGVRGDRARMADARQRLFQALRAGATVTAAAARAGLPVDLAAVMVDEMRRTGLLTDAASLCASGLGACRTGGLEGASAQVRVHCSGCPLIPLAPRRGSARPSGRLPAVRGWLARR